MANLTRTWRWERFEPDIGDNLSLPEKERLALRIASGLSAERLKQFHAEKTEAFKSGDEPTMVTAFAAAHAGIVELEGTHTIEGRPVASLADYLGVLWDMRGSYNLNELASAVEEFNSIQGTQRLFSQRFSGGLLTTRAQSAAKAEPATDAR